jgi:hypothetical protein
MLGAHHILHVSRIRANIKADGTYSYHRSLKTKPETANTKNTIPKK